MRVPAGDIERLVLDRLRAFFSSRIDVSDALAPLDLEARALDAALRNAFGLSERWLAAPPVEMKSLVMNAYRCCVTSTARAYTQSLCAPFNRQAGAPVSRLTRPLD